MFKKSLLLTLLLALLVPWAAKGQQTRTVYDNEDTNIYVPTYGNWADAYTKCEFVMPAEDATNGLTMMTGGTITKMKFYIKQVSSGGNGWSSNTFQVFLKEIEGTTISAWQGTEDATIVYEGSLPNPTAGEYEITFTNGYEYNGGNLLVGIYNTTSVTSGYRDATFYGKTVTGASGSNYNSSALSSVSFSQRNFLPKTTFTYVTTAPYISLNTSSTTILTGNTEELTATYGNVTGTPNITYTSDDESIATVSGSGTSATVTAVGEGTATITATMTYNEVNYTSTCQITVLDACQPTWTGTYNYYISKFKVSLSETTLLENSSTGTKKTTTNYYATKSITAQPGDVLSCEITMNGASSTYGFALWVDFDGDGLEAADRKFYSDGYKGSPYTNTLTIPANTSAGEYRLRIMGDYNNGTLSDPCGSYKDGEAEDYKLIVVVPTCPKPTDLTASLTEGNGEIATLSWTESGEATEWTLEYGTNSDFTGATSENVTGTPSKDITGLTAEAVYYARVKAVCTAGTDESDWSAVYSFWPTSTVPVMVNNGSTTNSSIPFYGYYTNKTPNGSQFIIPATTLENINPGSTINKIILYGSTTSALSWGSATFNVYMKEVENTTFASASDMVDWTSLTNVYNGSLTYSSQQMEILFDNDFVYNGGNLLIGFNIDETASSTGSTVSFYGINGIGNCSAYKYMGYSSIQSGVSSFLPKITFRVIQAEIACDKAKNLEHSAVDHEQATITWTSDESAWQIVWSDDASFDPNGATPTNVTEKTYTIPGLSPLTDYYVYVRSDCGSSNYGDWSNVHHFKTTAYAAPVGDYWADNFEGDECGWELINGTLTNKWTHGEATFNGESGKSIYISNNSGTSNAYSTSYYTMAYATKLLHFENNKYTFEYDWKAKGEEGWDFLRVVLVPADVTLTAGTSLPSGFNYNATPANWIAIDGGSQLYGKDTWQTKNVTVTVPTGNYYVVLAWRNDDSGGTQPPAAVDNFSITRVTCPYDVEDLAVATDPAVAQTTATVTWTAGEASGWQVAYSTDANFTDGSTTYKTVTEASADLTGLTAATYYYVKVRAYCGGTDYGTWCNAISFHTECLDAQPLPYFNGFEGAAESNMPLCWTRMGTSTTYPMISTASHNEGAKSLYFYNTSATTNANQIAALPAIDGDLNTVRVVFYAKYTSEAPIKVGYVTDLTDAETFVEKAEVTLTDDFERYSVSCANWGDVTGYIAFKTVYNGTSNTGVYLDDVTVELIPDCVDPSGLSVDPTSITTTEADISWTAGGDETQWQAALKRNNGEWENYPTLFDATSGHLTNLTPSSIYQVKVRSYCSPSEQSPWSDPVEFKTDCEPFTVTELTSYQQPFEFPEGGLASVNSDILPVCWDHYGTNSNWPHISKSSGSWSYGYYVHEGTQALSFYGETVYAIMPEFSNNLSDLQISFWMQMENKDKGTLTLGYITGEDDGTCNTFQVIEACATNQDEMVQRLIYLSNVPNTATRLVFRWAGSSNYTCCIDDVEVSLAPSCLSVKTLSYNTLKAHQVNLAVILNDNSQDHFDIQYADDADFTANVVLVENAEFTENAYTLTGLTANHPYYVRVRANCGESTSPWSSAINFTTNIGNPAPSGLAVDTDGHGVHSITLKWTNGGGDYETSWQIAYSTDTDFNPDEVTPVDADTNPFTLTGLNHNTTYYGRVRSNCGTDGMSAWSAKQSFSTLNATTTPTLNAATDITSEGATISWTAPADNDHHQSYELYYSTENTAPTETPEAGDNYIQGITETSYDLTGLDDLTKYYVWVRDICGEDGNSPWSTTPKSFTTLQTPVVIDADHDFTDDFEGENCNWVLVNGELTNAWAHGDATNNGGDKAMYISNDGGSSNEYNNSKEVVVYASKLFTLAEGTYSYGYDWKANGEITSGTPYDYLRVALVPAGTILTASTSLPSGLTYNGLPTGWTALDGGSQLNLQTDWTTYNSEITIDSEGNYMVVFVWRDDTSGGDNPPAAIDNFHIGVSLCNMPADLAASVTSTSATITWTSTNDNFTLRYKKVSEEVWSAEIHVTGTSYTLDNVLEAKTAYNVEVVSNCAEGDSDPANITFTTAYSIPFEEVFTANELPDNWARYSGSAANAYAGTNPTTYNSSWYFNNTHAFGEYHAKMNMYKHYNYWLVTPNIDLTTATDPSKLYLIFDFAVTNYNSSNAPDSGEPSNDDEFRVMVSTNSGATWTETNSWVWKNSGGDFVFSQVPRTGETIMLPLASYASGSVMVAFYGGANNDVTSIDYDIHIDNVRVMEIADNILITEGNWNTGSNWQGGEVPSTNEDVLIIAPVTIPATATITVEDITISASGSITIANGGVLNCTGNAYTPNASSIIIEEGGQLIHDNPVNATIQRHVNSYNGKGGSGYLFIASPVNDPILVASTDLAQNNYDLYIFDESQPTKEWRNFKAGEFATIDNEKGYLYANNQDLDISFIGTLRPNNEDAVINLAYTDGNRCAGWNLVGNPFACNTYIKDASSSEMAFYRMNSTGDDYTAATGAIAPMEGVFVQAKAEGQSFKFTRTEPSKGVSNLNINVARVVNSRDARPETDNAIIRFDNGETLEKFSLRDNTAKVYIPQDNKDYAVVSAEAYGELPVNFKAAENGTYTISFTTENVEFSYLHLIDNMKGNDVNLLENPSYSFDAQYTDFASRFKLVFAKNSGNMGDDFGFIDANGNLMVLGIEGVATLQVIDVTGRILSSETFSGNYSKSVNAAAGVYMLRLIQGNDSRTQKIVVK